MALPLLCLCSWGGVHLQAPRLDSCGELEQKASPSFSPGRRRQEGRSRGFLLTDPWGSGSPWPLRRSALPSARVQFPGCPAAAGSVTFVWAGGHICAIKGASTGEDVNVFPQPERWFELSQSSPSEQAEACQWKAGGCWEITRQQNENHYQSRPGPKEGQPLKPQTG